MGTVINMDLKTLSWGGLKGLRAAEKISAIKAKGPTPASERAFQLNTPETPKMSVFVQPSELKLKVCSLSPRS